MTRDASANHPYDLFLPTVQEGEPTAEVRIEALPEDDRILDVLREGPLLPFDYCYLRGQREGLVPVVQTQLVMRNPRLVKVDRTPLGIDPNADLFRCFLMHGNPNEPVTVFTFYERDICSGVVSGYFHVPEIKRHLYMHFSRKGWLTGNAITNEGATWLEAYDAALLYLWDMLQVDDIRERAAIASEWAEWVHPILRRLDRADGIRTTDQEQQALTATHPEELSAGRRDYWEFVGNFTFLSIISRPAFCAFAWLKQVQFPHLSREDPELVRTRGGGIYRPRLLVPGIAAFFVGMLIVGHGIGSGSSNAWQLSGPLIFGGLPMLAGLAMMLSNLAFWVMYTSGSPVLGHLVPATYTRGRPRNVGYLR